MKKVLVTGATGQIGSELTTTLREKLGMQNVIAAGHKKTPEQTFHESGPFHFIDVNRIETIAALVERYKVDTIYHLAAILSATAEKNRNLAGISI